MRFITGSSTLQRAALPTANKKPPWIQGGSYIKNNAVLHILGDYFFYLRYHSLHHSFNAGFKRNH